jgi:predicted RNA-binding Zn ribbon-like protein
VDTKFRFDCGATWLNLLATRGRTFGAHPIERIPTPERLSAWLAQSELTPSHPSPLPSQADLERVRALRETLRALALATVEDEPPAEEAVAALTPFLADPPDPVRLLIAERLRREPPSSVEAALARIARQAVDQLTGPERHTLKVCPEHDCRGVFADPADRRRWCPAPACASRGRVRALRARRAEEERQRS